MICTSFLGRVVSGLAFRPSSHFSRRQTRKRLGIPRYFKGTHSALCALLSSVHSIIAYQRRRGSFAPIPSDGGNITRARRLSSPSRLSGGMRCPNGTTKGFDGLVTSGEQRWAERVLNRMRALRQAVTLMSSLQGCLSEQKEPPSKRACIHV